MADQPGPGDGQPEADDAPDVTTTEAGVAALGDGAVDEVDPTTDDPGAEDVDTMPDVKIAEDGDATPDGGVTAEVGAADTRADARVEEAFGPVGQDRAAAIDPSVPETPADSDQPEQASGIGAAAAVGASGDANGDAAALADDDGVPPNGFPPRVADPRDEGGRPCPCNPPGPPDSPEPCEQPALKVAIDGLIESELAEVFLLLDNISATKSKTLPASMGDDGVFADPGGKGWLEQVCDIQWPPAGSHINDGRNAAKLLRVRDMLNAAAAPATGYTIAFALMMAGEARETRRWRLKAPWPFIERTTETRDQPGGQSGSPSARRAFAAQAFPMLNQHVRTNRTSWFALRLVVVLWLVMTCLFSWHVAAGVSLLDRYNVLENSILSVRVAAANTTKTGATPDAASDTGTGTGTAPTAAPPAPAPAPAPPLAGRGARPPASPTASATPRRSDDGKPVTAASQDGAAGKAEGAGDLVTLTTLRDQADRNLADWLTGEGWFSLILLNATGGQDEQRFMTPPPLPPLPALSSASASASTPAAAPIPAPPAKANVEWARVYISLLAGTVLPILYGFLGAGAAVVRSVSAKLRDSTLNPRDLSLAWVQLGLGAVIACCIGLFVPGGGGASNTSSGLLTSVQLTLSALCFVAGFGVEGVFQALEALVRRLFNLDPPAVPPGG